jgi:ACS family glucarate transporter-like MFS transporter
MTYFPVRFRLVIITFSLTLLLYIDRVAISAAKNEIGEELDLTDTQLGWIMSAFALGYALFQVPSGMLADKLGPRKVISAIVSVWSLFTALTGAAWNFISILVIRFLFGIGEAGAFPGLSRAIFTWIPMKERGIVTGINFSGSRLGAAFAFPLVTWLIMYFGWRGGFYFMGGVGVLWALFWFWWFRDSPENHTSVTSQEKEYILATRQKEEESPKELFSIGRLLQSRNIWLAMSQYFASNFIFFFCLTWMFPYLRDRFSVDAYEASFYAMFPLLSGAIGNWISGWLVDFIYKHYNWKRSRTVPAITGFALVGIGVIGILSASGILFAVISLSIAVFGADMTLSPSWSFCMDIGKKHAGTVSGTMNMAGNIGSFVTAIAFPYLVVWTGTTDTFFIIAGVLVVIAICAWLFMDPEKSVLTGEKEI